MRKLLLLPALLCAFSCTAPGEGPRQAGQEPAALPVSQPAETESQMIGMMETVFEGDHSKAQIKEKMDQVLQAYKLEVSEDNYNTVGSALVAMRKDSKTGVTEMQILDCVIASKKKGINDDIGDQIGLCASLLE